MNKHIALAAIAPFALLSACGSNESDADDPATNPANSVMMESPVSTSAAATATRLADAGDFSGSYDLADPTDAELAIVSDQASTEADSAAGSGTAAAFAGGSIRFNSADNTYEYTPADGAVRTGSFSRADDNYRILIEDFDGGPAYFAFSNGDLYRLANNTPMSDTINVTGDRYARNNNSDNPTPGNPSGATNSVKDKRE